MAARLTRALDGACVPHCAGLCWLAAVMRFQNGCGSDRPSDQVWYLSRPVPPQTDSAERAIAPHVFWSGENAPEESIGAGPVSGGGGDGSTGRSNGPQNQDISATVKSRSTVTDAFLPRIKRQQDVAWLPRIGAKRFVQSSCGTTTQLRNHACRHLRTWMIR